MSVAGDVLTHSTVWLDGRSFVGECESITLPKLSTKKQAYAAGGLSAEVDVPMGLFEKLEASFSFNTMNPNHLNMIGITLGNQINVSARGSLHSNDGTQIPIKVSLRGAVTELDDGEWKTGELTKPKLSMGSITYYRKEINGKVIHEIDVLNGLAVINGVDQLAKTRAHLGV